MSSEARAGICNQNSAEDVIIASGSFLDPKTNEFYLGRFKKWVADGKDPVSELKALNQSPGAYYLYFLYINKQPPCQENYDALLTAMEKAYPSKGDVCRALWSKDHWESQGKSRKDIRSARSSLRSYTSSVGEPSFAAPCINVSYADIAVVRFPRFAGAAFVRGRGACIVAMKRAASIRSFEDYFLPLPATSSL